MRLTSEIIVVVESVGSGNRACMKENIVLYIFAKTQMLKLKCLKTDV